MEEEGRDSSNVGVDETTGVIRAGGSDSTEVEAA